MRQAIAGPAAHHRLRWVLAAVASVALWLGHADGARGYVCMSPHVYWTNTSYVLPMGPIGRADIDGTGINQALLLGKFKVVKVNGKKVKTRLPYTGSAAWVSLGPGLDVHWTNPGGIGRAGFAGFPAVGGFIAQSLPAPAGIAVDSNYIYWADRQAGMISRANLDGTGAVQNFITGASDPIGVAVDSGHIYWANHGGNSIGRADLNGGNVNQLFIDASGPVGVAVDSGHVYWTSDTNNAIGRANLNASSPDPTFIPGLNKPQGIATDGFKIYWANNGTNTIGRVNPDGTGLNSSFIGGAASPVGVALDSLPIAVRSCKYLPLNLNRKLGTATLGIQLPGPGVIKFKGPGIVTAKKSVGVAAGGGARSAATISVRLPIRARGAARGTLDRRGRVTVRFKVIYLPQGGGIQATNKRATLIRTG